MAKDNVFTERKRPRGKEIRIPRISPMLHSDITNIAAHLGVSVADFMKTQLLTIIGNHPAHYREPMLKD